MDEPNDLLHAPIPGELTVLGGDGNDVLVEGPCPNTTVAFQGKGNRVSIAHGNPGKGVVNIGVVGDGNMIRINCLHTDGNVTIRCGGDEGEIEIGRLWIGESLVLLNGGELAGVRSRCAKCRIGSDVAAESLTVLNYHTDGEVRVGDGCMMAHQVTLMNSDTHPIYDLRTGKIINRPRGPLDIGKRVWLGMRATVMKGVSIADECIVAYNATVTKSCREPHVALAGCPARVVRRNVRWDKQDVGFM